MRETKTNSTVKEADVTHYQSFEILKYANQFWSHKNILSMRWWLVQNLRKNLLDKLVMTVVCDMETRGKFSDLSFYYYHRYS